MQVESKTLRVLFKLRLNNVIVMIAGNIKVWNHMLNIKKIKALTWMCDEYLFENFKYVLLRFYIFKNV